MDEIRVKNLEVFCHHGVYKEENVLGQKFLVNIVSKVDFPARPRPPFAAPSQRLSAARVGSI